MRTLSTNAATTAAGLGDVFQAACADLGEIAHKAKADPAQLADRAVEAITNNSYSQYNDLVSILAPALGQEGLERLKQRMVDLSVESATHSANEGVAKIGGSDLDSSEDEWSERFRLETIRNALRDVADAQGDVDGFIAQYDEETRILAPTARALESEHPLAATLVLRAMIDFTLSKGKSTRYKHAARNLSKCSRLSTGISDFQTHETHDAYKQRLRCDHGRKRSFWDLID